MYPELTSARSPCRPSGSASRSPSSAPARWSGSASSSSAGRSSGATRWASRRWSAALVGSRVYYLVQNYSEVKGDLLGHLFSGSGLVWYGGAIGGALAVLGWAYWRGFLNLTLLDVAAPALALGYAIGRIGCQMSGDGDYGKPWNGPWAMAYPQRDRADQGDGPADADLRDAGDGLRRLAPLAPARPRAGRLPLRALPALRRDGALPGRVSAPKHARFPGTHRRPAGVSR